MKKEIFFFKRRSSWAYWNLSIPGTEREHRRFLAPQCFCYCKSNFRSKRYAAVLFLFFSFIIFGIFIRLNVSLEFAHTKDSPNNIVVQKFVDNIIALKSHIAHQHMKGVEFILLQERKSVCSTSHTKMKLGFIRFRKIDGFNFVNRKRILWVEGYWEKTYS